MAKLTENAVLFLTADNRQIFVDKVCGAGNAGYNEGDQIPETPGKKFKRKTILVDTLTYVAGRNTYKIEDCYEPDITTVTGQNLFLKGHNGLPIEPKSGYDSFVNGQGATNPISDKGFKPDATARIALCYVQALMIQKAAGGDNGKRASALLDTLQQYLTDKEAAKAAKELSRKFVVAVTKKNKVSDLTAEEKKDLAEFLELRRQQRAAKAVLQPPTVNDEDVEDDIDADIDETVEDRSDIEADAEVTG